MFSRGKIEGGNSRNHSIDNDGKQKNSPKSLVVARSIVLQLSEDGVTQPSSPPQLPQCFSSPGTSSVSQLTVAEFGTLHYGCRGEIKAVLFNDGPETAPFMVSIDMEGNRGVRGGSAAGADKKGGKEQLPFEVCIAERLFAGGEGRLISFPLSVCMSLTLNFADWVARVVHTLLFNNQPSNKHSFLHCGSALESARGQRLLPSTGKCFSSTEKLTDIP